jgi:hypothetical protein
MGPDCNDNNVPDSIDIINDPSIDCNLNGVPDSCEITPTTDCDGDGLLDTCESCVVDLAIYLDRSGSMRNNNARVCTLRDEIIADVRMMLNTRLRIFFTASGSNDAVADCSQEGAEFYDITGLPTGDGQFVGLNCGDNANEEWANAGAALASLGTLTQPAGLGWRPGANRIVLLVSDTGPVCDQLNDARVAEVVQRLLVINNSASIGEHVTVSLVVPGGYQPDIVQNQISAGSVATATGGFVFPIINSPTLGQSLSGINPASLRAAMIAAVRTGAMCPEDYDLDGIGNRCDPCDSCADPDPIYVVTTDAPDAYLCVGVPCDTLDFDGDGVFPDAQDIQFLLDLFSGEPCPVGFYCDDIDFNNDCVAPDSTDIQAYLEVFAGDSCKFHP